jgi:acetyl-CoA carboxylase alpha subunit
MFFDLEKLFVKRQDLCRTSRPRGGELIRRVCQDFFEMSGCRHFGF